MAERILRLTVGLFVGVWVARYLGPEQFGLFSYAQSFVGLFAVIATFGLDSIVVRELVKDEQRKYELIGTALFLKLLGAFITLGILATAVLFTSNNTLTNILIFIIASATIFQSFNVIDFYFQSKVKSKYVVYANVISLFLSSVAKIVLILKDAPLEYFALVVLFDSFILACGLIYFFLRKTNISVKKIRFKTDTAVLLLRDSWPLIIAGLALSMQSYIDQVMLKEMVGLVEVGYYSVAFKLMAVFGFLPMIIQSTLLPAIINSKKVSLTFYKFRMLNFYRLMMIMFVLTAAPIYFLGEWIVLFLYGEPYAAVGGLFSIFGLRLFFAFFGVGRSNYLLNENMQKHALYTLIFASALNVVLNYIFIPIYGIYGAIITTFISFTVNIFVLDLLMKSSRDNAISMIKAMFSFWKLKLKRDKNYGPA